MKLLSQLQIAECVSQPTAVQTQQSQTGPGTVQPVSAPFTLMCLTGISLTGCMSSPHRTIGYIVTQVPLVKRLSLHLLYPTYMYV